MERLTRISPAELDGLVYQARAEHWTQLMLLGPNVRVGNDVENWSRELQEASRVFRLTALTEGLADKLQALHLAQSMGQQHRDEGAKAIAASLKGLTSLDLSYNSIGDEGAKVIAASLKGLTSRDLSLNIIGAEGAKAIAASLKKHLFVMRHGQLTEGLCPNDRKNIAPRSAAAQTPTTRQKPPAPGIAASKLVRKRERF